MKRVKRLDKIIDETAAPGTPIQRKGKTRREEMTAQYTIRFGSRNPILISHVADVVKVLADPRWPGAGGPLHKEAVRISAEALAGHCTPAIALAAFRRAAAEAGILDKTISTKK
jgi:hypothetical protein